MDENELWLSEEESEDEGWTDPVAFTLALNYQGPPGGILPARQAEFRTRNRPGQRQRPTVSAFRGGSRKKPVFTTTCNAKAMIHGEMGSDSPNYATLLVYEFQFRSYKGARLKEADILFEFKPPPGASGGISVADVRPIGVHKIERSDEIESHGVFAGANGALLQAIGIEAGVESSVEKVAKYHTVITGDRPQDDWGDYYEARFSLMENKSQEDGIPSSLTVCILLERDADEDFVCVPTISVKPNFLTTVATLFSSRDPDDPIPFSVEEPPYNILGSEVGVDRSNLRATDLGSLWDCTMYNDYTGAIKPSKPKKPDTAE